MPRTVHRGTVRVESGPQRFFLAVRFDPVDRAIVAEPFDVAALEPNVVYRLKVEGVRDLDDRVIDEPFVATFRTGEELGAIDARPEAGWAAVEPIFTGRCAGVGCHGPGPAPLGLDLSSAEAVRRTAIGVLSKQLPSGTTGAEGGSGALALAGLPIVDVVAGSGRPATSYLLYKVLGDPHAFGDPMPPTQLLDPAFALSAEELRTLADWILAGAPTE